MLRGFAVEVVEEVEEASPLRLLRGFAVEVVEGLRC